MENTTLVGLLDLDKELVLADLGRDRSPGAAQTALEKALDRVTLRYVEQCAEGAARDMAQQLARTMKSALPLMDTVSEVRRWERDVKSETRKWKPASLALLAVGAVLVLSVMLGLVMTGRRASGILTMIEAIIPALIGMAALFMAGVKRAAPEKAPEAAGVREEFLIDPQAAWHHLRGMLMMADSALESVSADEKARKQAEAADVSRSALSSDEAELFSGLLENAYAQDNPDSREMIEAIRFYLHGAGVDVVDYEKGREAWFEFLPAQRGGTIRPALTSDNRLVRKGLASA